MYYLYLPRAVTLQGTVFSTKNWSRSARSGVRRHGLEWSGSEQGRWRALM